jgi:hypothetical protein
LVIAGASDAVAALVAADASGVTTEVASTGAVDFLVVAGAVVAGAAAFLVMVLAPKVLNDFVNDDGWCGLESGDVFQQAEQCFGEILEAHFCSEFLNEDFHQLLLLIGC